MKKLSIVLGFLLAFLSIQSASASPITADTVVLIPKASVSCPTSKACLYALSGDGQLYITDSSGIQIRTNTALRFYPKASPPGTPSNGDVYFNTGSGKYQFYASGWGPLPASSGGTGIDGSAVAINLVLASPASGSPGPLLARALVTADLPIIALTKGGTAQDNSSILRNLFFASPTSGTGAASFRAIDASDIPGPTIASIYSGMFSAAALVITPASTKYLGPAGSATDNAGRVTIHKVPAGTGQLQSLECDVGTAPGGTDTIAFTIGTSTDQGATWVDTSITCTITGVAKICVDNTHAVAVTEGTRVSVKQVSSATAVAADANCSWRLTK